MPMLRLVQDSEKIRTAQQLSAQRLSARCAKLSVSAEILSSVISIQAHTCCRRFRSSKVIPKRNAATAAEAVNTSQTAIDHLISKANPHTQNTLTLSATRLTSQSIRALVVAFGYLSTVTTAAGVLDIGLVFPRTNVLYSPSDDFPIVFAAQNSKWAEHLNLSIWYQVLNITGDIEILVDGTHEFNWTSASKHDPYLLWSPLKLGGESKLRVLWQPRWTSCNQSHQEVSLARNRTDNFLVDFEVGASGQKVDLMDATNNDNSASCPNEGVGIDVTDKTLEAVTESSLLETCAVLGSFPPTPISNPCKVKIDKATAESMAAVDLAEKCRGSNQPSKCPKSGLANSRFAVAGVSTLTAVFGAAVFLA